MPKVRPLPPTFSTSRRWTEDEARAVLAAQDMSGLSIAAFAAQQEIDPQRLYQWRRRLGSTKKTPTPAFIEVRPSAKREVIEITLRCGRVVRVAETIDPSTLRRLVDAIEREPSC